MEQNEVGTSTPVVPKVEEMSIDGSTTNRGSFYDNSFKSKYMDPNSGDWNLLNRKAKKFYASQNEEIEAFEEADLLVGARTEAQVQAHNAQTTHNDFMEKVVVYVSFGANCCLLAALITAAIFTGSIAVVASVIDSSLDIFSSFIIVFTSVGKKKFNKYKYPQGRERLEPVGVLVFSAVMGTTSLFLIIESIKRFMEPKDLEFDNLSLGLVIGDVSIKFLLFLLCLQQSKKSLVAQALAQDHRNDVVVNSVVLICSYLGFKYWPYLDPLGAILISCWTIFNWGSSCMEQVKVLTGRSASPEFLKRLTWVCINHSPNRVVAVDTVRAFHFGTRYLVEVDIVLPPNMPLKDAHDIGEELQKKIEKFEEVERAFVHLDYETSHHPDSEHKQWGK